MAASAHRSAGGGTVGRRARPAGPTLLSPLLLALFAAAARAETPGAPGGARPAPSREVRVGLYENKPKIFTDERGGAAGIFPAILDEIARREQWRVTYVPCEWHGCLEALGAGRLDLMPDVAISPQREALFDFHAEEVAGSWSAVYARGGRQLSGIADLDGRRVAVLRGSIQRTSLAELVRGFGYTVSFVEADSFEEAYRLTARGAADAVVANHFSGDYFHQRYGLRKTPIVFNPAALYFATAAGANRDLLGAIDRHLRRMKADPGSLYYRALARWMEEPTVVVPPYLKWTLGGVSAVLALSLMFVVVLRWQVRAGTRHLEEAGARLRESEQMFRDLFHKHTAVKLLIDPADGRIVEANEAAEAFYGWPRETLRTMRIHEINTLPPEQVQAELAKAAHGRQAHFEFRHRLADGSVRDVAVFSSRIDLKGRPLLHSIVQDISERRSLEEQLRQAHKMEAVGRLAGGVAHDYNNMLGVILGRTELALSRIDPADPLHAQLRQVLEAATRSADITKQLLAFARKQTVAPRVLDLNGTVAEMLKMLRWLIGENIELVFLPGAGLWRVKIDPAQVDQVLANLCINARDAVAGTGRIVIRTENATLDAAYCAEHPGCEPGDYVRLCVSDDGCGMTPAMLAHAFEPFYTTKDAGQGTGLGLATVYGIVKQNRGSIDIASEPREGTTFRLAFPRHEGPLEEPAAAGAAPAPRGSGETVLLVEDDRSIRELTREMLEALGYRVLAAATPGEALRLSDEDAGGVDLLVTDVIMPEMNGRELAGRLRDRRPALRTLFMSGYTADIIARQGVLDEGVLFLQKPFTQGELAEKIREGLAG